MASITSGTPWPRASGAKLVTSNVTISPPITGTRMMKAPHAPRTCGREQIGVVGKREPAEEGHVVDQRDQGAEEHGARAGDRADHDREQA
jgi:hypothetical protein